MSQEYEPGLVFGVGVTPSFHASTFKAAKIMCQRHQYQTKPKDGLVYIKYSIL